MNPRASRRPCEVESRASALMRSQVKQLQVLSGSGYGCGLDGWSTDVMCVTTGLRDSVVLCAEIAWDDDVEVRERQ